MKEDKIYLQHILDAIKNEAVKKLSSDLKKNYKNIPWKDIAGLRDKLIHNYFGVDILLVWTICKRDIPELKKFISKILQITKNKKEISG
jgi:uncharacterized protein with HEPN domain